MTEDWAAVGQAISARMAQLRVTQLDVAARADISLTTLRELQNNTNPRRRRSQTLAALSEALGWPAGHLSDVLHGQEPRVHPDEEQDPVLRSLRSIEKELLDLRSRVDQIEQRLAGEDA